MTMYGSYTEHIECNNALAEHCFILGQKNIYGKSTNNNKLCMTLSNDTTNERRQFIIAKNYISEHFFISFCCWRYWQLFAGYVLNLLFLLLFFIFFIISIIEHKHVLPPLPSRYSKTTTTANSFILFHIINLKLLSG